MKNEIWTTGVKLTLEKRYDMDSNTDLTLFWLAWQKTCSIRLCCVGHEREYRERCSDSQELCEKMELVQELAQNVMKSMNSHFILRLGKENEEKGLRLSVYSSEAEDWKHGYSHGSAFELLEAHLYNKQFLSGKQFKAYLFENIADRPGGMSRNLFGYLQRVLRTIVRESYGENVYQPLQDEDGKDVVQEYPWMAVRLSRQLQRQKNAQKPVRLRTPFAFI